MMRTSAYLLVVLLFTLGMGCSRERAKVVEPGVKSESKDYREMIERSRNRQTVEGTLTVLQEAVRKFQVDLGRLPTNIFELAALGYLTNVPHPPQGYDFAYDPVHGNINVVTLPPASGVTAPADVTNRPSVLP